MANRTYEFENITDALPYLLRDLYRAPEIGSRVALTRELTQVAIKLHKPWQRELLLPARKANVVAQIAETAWVLAGRNDVEWLANYLPRARDYSDDGATWRSGYGPRLRAFTQSMSRRVGQVEVDQLAYVVNALKTDPETRQAVISLWDPRVDTEPGKDHACNNWLHFLAREGKLDLHVATRSNDVMWGWSGINAFEWSVLLEVVAGLTGLEQGSLHFSISSLHLYEQHWERAQKIYEEAFATERVTVDDSPRFLPLSDETDDFDQLLDRWFRLEYDIRTGSPMVSAYIDTFPEPMLKSWLIALDWWWNGPFHGSVELLEGTALGTALKMGVQPPWMKSSVDRPLGHTGLEVSPFLRYVHELHNQKHAAYGDSWKRRGEYMILANIARKVDRLGAGETDDETQADTAIDLLVYTAKYVEWLNDQEMNFNASDDTRGPNERMVGVERSGTKFAGNDETAEILEDMLRDSFADLEDRFHAHASRSERADGMLRQAYRLARYRWEAAQQSNDYRGADHD